MILNIANNKVITVFRETKSGGIIQITEWHYLFALSSVLRLSNVIIYVEFEQWIPIKPVLGTLIYRQIVQYPWSQFKHDFSKNGSNLLEHFSKIS